MIKIFVYSCLLSALSIVEMKMLDIVGHAGENVTFTCSDWKSWTNVKSNDKYFCKDPCSEDKHIINKAASGKTTRKKRIEVTNSEDNLFVTFTNLQKSDSGKYYCGVERVGLDSFIEVHLKVTEALQTAPTTVITSSTLSSAVTNSSTVSSDGSDNITDTSISNIIHSTTTTHTAPETQGAGSVPYLIIGAIMIITILIVLLKLMRKMMKKQLKEEDAREDVKYEEIRPEDQQTVSPPAVFSALHISADPDSLYVNYSYHQDAELAAGTGYNSSNNFSLNSASRVAYADSRVTDPQCDLVYSFAQLPKEQIEPTGQSEPNQS